MCGKEGYARNDNHRLRRWLWFCLPLPKSAQKIPWKFCEIATIQITDYVIKCK